MSETLNQGEKVDRTETLNDGVRILARDRQLGDTAVAKVVEVPEDIQPEVQDSTEAAA